MATVLESSEKDRLDLWHIKNTAVRIDSVSVKLAGAGEFVKNKTGIPLQRVNQSYEVSVRFDFLGNREMARNMIQGCVKELNENLPVGYKAKSPEFSGIFNERKSDYFGLVLLSIAAIFVILSVYFESLMLPLSIIAMIPLSFVGSFLAFGISGIPFDRGGFASMVMLCGIVVNAGIYLLSSCKGNYVTRRDYVKAFQYKSAPIFLTVASTILGLIPFLLDGPSEVFWFDFAFGTVSGLIFSVIAIVFLLPVLAVKLR